MAVLLGGLLLAQGCSAAPPSRGGSTGATSRPPSIASPLTAQEISLSTDGFVPSGIPGLTVVQDGSEDAGCAWSTAYPDVPGAPELTALLTHEVDREVRSWNLSLPGRAWPTCDAPAGGQHQLGFDFLVASTDVVGVRLSDHDPAAHDPAAHDPAEGGRRYGRTYWYDARTHTAGPALTLITPQARGALAARLTAELVQRYPDDASAVQTALDETHRDGALGDLSLDGLGALHVRFAAGAAGASPTGPREVVVPAPEAAPWLSDLGLRVRAQALHPDGPLDVDPIADPVAFPQGAAVGDPTGTAVSTGTALSTGAAAGAVDCRVVKCIALTFDDGPGPYTAELLATLRKYSAHATFFVIGQSVTASPWLVRAELAAGHQVGNHSWSHPDLTRLTAAQVAQQFALTDAALRAATGGTPTLVRPPFGSYNPVVRRVAARPLILWNRDTLDWKYRSVSHVVNAVLGSARPGDIVLMHDIHPTTVRAVPQILKVLAARGFHFVTISELLGPNLTPGTLYFSRTNSR